MRRPRHAAGGAGAAFGLPLPSGRGPCRRGRRCTAHRPANAAATRELRGVHDGRAAQVVVEVHTHIVLAGRPGVDDATGPGLQRLAAVALRQPCDAARETVRTPTTPYATAASPGGDHRSAQHRALPCRSSTARSFRSPTTRCAGVRRPPEPCRERRSGGRPEPRECHSAFHGCGAAQRLTSDAVVIPAPVRVGRPVDPDPDPDVRRATALAQPRRGGVLVLEARSPDTASRAMS